MTRIASISDRRPGGPYTVSGAVAFAQRERLQHPGQAEPVVGVVVRDEYLLDVGQADRTQQLALRAFAAVEKQAVAAALHDARRQPSVTARNRSAGAREEDR